MPPPHDPDSFIKANGGAAFNDLIKNAAGFFDYYLNRLCATNDVETDKGRTIVVRSMLQALQKTGNTVTFDKYAHALTFKLKLSFKSIVDEFKKILEEQPAPTAKNEENLLQDAEPTAEIAPPSPLEFHLLKLLLLHDDLVGTATLNLDVNWILHPHVRQIVDLRFAAQEHQTWHNLAEFLDSCESAEQRSLITEAVAEDRKIPNPETQLADMTLKLRNQFLDRQIGALTQKISQPQTGDEEKIALLREQMKLKEQKRSPLAMLEK
jgi:DNA primase